MKEFAGKAWAGFRKLPVWAQILIGLVVVGIVASPFTSPQEADEAASTADTVIESVVGSLATTSAPPTEVPPTEPPVTAAPTTAAAPTAAVPVRAQMPDIPCGTNLQVAQDAIQALGVFLSFSEDATGQGRNQVIDSNWTVVAQTPAAGTDIGEGEATLFVVKDEEFTGC